MEFVRRSQRRMSESAPAETMCWPSSAHATANTWPVWPPTSGRPRNPRSTVLVSEPRSHRTMQQSLPPETTVSAAALTATHVAGSLCLKWLLEGPAPKAAALSEPATRCWNRPEARIASLRSASPTASPPRRSETR
eukprot:Amastigsp_a508731_21.p4 type:complete len:136 gc:universal Amastigsp_a508731_21:762-1169(+)